MQEYKSKLTVLETQKAIRETRHRFEENLCDALNLSRVSAPLFVKKNSGINDDLNGVERPVSFDILQSGEVVEVVHSLAKWKRMALAKYGFKMHTGLYTDMNAIRRDEICDNVHSLYVDQWDWEKVINESDRTVEFLKNTVKRIYGAVVMTADYVERNYPCLDNYLPREVKFITTQELLDKYPTLNAKERETAIAKEYGAVFIMQIGGKLSNGEKHDGRAPDYDDWALNGDLIVYNRVLDSALELSSMGIRVDKVSLLKQLEAENALDRLELPFHKALVNGELPFTIGGGIGQSRLCMQLLQKAHIGEVHASVWPEEEIQKCKDANIELL
ncbi:MAG: aspartate--ammonia ligase [Acutalibacteraceae bacterium]|nr:aspartate--ammonia ligase [Acutalibacteraceae bacterium]